MDRKDRLEKKCLGTKLQKESCDHDVLGLSRRVTIDMCSFTRAGVAKDSVDAVPAFCACGALLRTKFARASGNRLPFRTIISSFEGINNIMVISIVLLIAVYVTFIRS